VGRSVAVDAVELAAAGEASSLRCHQMPGRASACGISVRG
jgi:hypothetical protein